MHTETLQLKDGHTVQYSIVGEGSPILVMHGGHSNCYEQFGYAELIDRGFQIITPSRPGYGETSEALGKSLGWPAKHI